MQDLSDSPWEEVAIDFKGLIGKDHRYILVCLDEFSRYPGIVLFSSEKCYTNIRKYF